MNQLPLAGNSKPVAEQSNEEVRKSIREVLLKQLERLRERSRLGAVLKPSELSALERLETGLLGQGSEPDQADDKGSSDIVDTIKALGKHYGKSPRTVKRWIAGGMPVLPGHRYDVSQIDAWLANGQGKKEPDHTEEKDFLVKGKSYWDAENKKHEAAMRKLRLEEKQGQLVKIEDVERAAFNLARQVRDGILNIPDRIDSMLAMESDSRKINTVLTKELRQALEVLTHAS